MVSIFTNLKAQSWQWAKTAQPGGYTPPTNYAHKMTADNSGNLYYTDATISAVTFGATTLNPGLATKYFLVKEDTNQNVIYANESAINAISQAIAIDDTGNVYVCGLHVVGTISASNELFIQKYNAAGTLVWTAYCLSAANSPYFSGITVDAAGNIYCTGFEFNTTTFSNSDFTNTAGNSLVAGGIGSPFTVKYNNAGFFQWGKLYNAGTTFLCRNTDVKCDAGGNTFVTGWADGGTMDFGNSITLTYTATFKGVYVVKFDNTGLAQWAKKGETTVPGATSQARSNAVVLDASGNVYVTGICDKPDFEGQVGTDFAAPFAIKYGPTGTKIWACYLSKYGEPLDLGVTSGGEVYIAGKSLFGATTAFTSFVAKINSGGSFAGRLEADPQTNLCNAENLRVDSLDNIFVSGSFVISSVFGATTLTNTADPTQGQKGIYFAKINPADAGPTAVSGPQHAKSKLYPNPFSSDVVKYISDRNLFTTSTEIYLIDITGRQVAYRAFYPDMNTLELEISDNPSGVYFLRIKTQDGRNETLRLVKE